MIVKMIRSHLVISVETQKKFSPSRSLEVWTGAIIGDGDRKRGFHAAPKNYQMLNSLQLLFANILGNLM